MKSMKTYLAGLMLITVFTSYSQEIDIYSIDSGGAVSSNGGINVVYSMGEITTVEPVVGGIAISSGFINKSIYATSYITSTIDFQSADDLEFLIYPNPASENVYIKTSLRIDHVVLFDSRGHKLMEHSNNAEILDVSTLKPGLYILRIIIGDQTQSESILIY